LIPFKNFTLIASKFHLEVIKELPRLYCAKNMQIDTRENSFCFARNQSDLCLSSNLDCEMWLDAHIHRWKCIFGQFEYIILKNISHSSLQHVSYFWYWLSLYWINLVKSPYNIWKFNFPIKGVWEHLNTKHYYHTYETFHTYICIVCEWVC
jgi:hypothetical protein